MGDLLLDWLSKHGEGGFFALCLLLAVIVYFTLMGIHNYMHYGDVFHISTDYEQTYDEDD